MMKTKLTISIAAMFALIAVAGIGCKSLSKSHNTVAEETVSAMEGRSVSSAGGSVSSEAIAASDNSTASMAEAKGPITDAPVQSGQRVQTGSAETATQPENLAPSQPSDTPLCLLQIGDTVEIKHYYHPDLNETVTVRADGKISLPLLDEIHVSGLTPEQLDDLLTEKYSRSLKQPELTVILRQSSAQRIFVGGEVIRPGLISMNGPLSCLQAVMQAGGYRDTAEPTNVVIMRNQGTEKPIFLVANLKYDPKKEILPENIALQPQDVVFVPRSKIAEINLWVEQYIDKVLPFSRSVGAYYSFDEGVTN